MIAALATALAAVVIVSLVLVMRAAEAAAWRRSLVGFRVRFPRGLTDEHVVAWLASLPPSAGLFGRPPVAFEVLASADGIEHRLYLPGKEAAGMSVQLQAALPGVRLERIDRDEPGVRRAVELRGASRSFPLATARAEMGARAVMASLLPLYSGELVVLQWLVCGASVPAVPRRRRDSAWFDREGVVDAEEVQGLRRKTSEPLLRAVVRIGVEAENEGRRQHLLGRVRAAMSVMDAPGMSLRASWLPSWLVVARLRELAVPLVDWPLRLNARELAGLLGVPLGEVELPGLVLGGARQLPAPHRDLRSGVLVARSDHPLSDGRELRLGTDDRLQHLHVIGPTGVGKSTLLANLALQDIAAGRGVVVIDPKRDLVESLLLRLPEQRLDDVVVLDPVDLDRPVGFNPLGRGRSLVGQELAAEHLLGVFRDLFADAWGPRTDDVMRAALRTLAATRATDGSRFTICELPELLSDADFRRAVLRQASVPEALRGFWRWFEAASEGERAAVIAPAMNKLRAFTTRTPIRLTLGQSEGFDLVRVFTERKVVLVPLSGGELGGPAAQLLGALLVAALWQTVQTRTRVAPERRHPVFIYLDEFQDIVRLPVPLPDMLAQARGLGVGLVLAHQYLQQLPREVRSAVLGTARSTVAFQLGHEDARAMEARFTPSLTAGDLGGLDARHVALRALQRGQVLRPVTGTTEPLPEPTLAAGVAARLSRGWYGMPHRDVEAGLRARTARSDSGAPIGRKRRAA